MSRRSVYRYFKISVILYLALGMGYAADLTHGPVVGGVTSQSATFVLRVDAAADVSVELAMNKDFSGSVFTNTVSADSARDYFVKVTVSGLAADTRYYYRPVIDGMAWDDGLERSFSTFPPEGEEASFTFLFGSGQQAGGDPHSNFGTIFPVMAEEDALFFLHQGDWTYPDTTDAEAGNPGNYFPLDYRNVQSSYRSRYTYDYPMETLWRKMAVDYTYDDHDLVDNNCDYTYPGIENSIRGYREMFPHYPLPSPEEGVWHKFTCGNVDVFMVDNRAQRSPNMEAFVTLPPNPYFSEETWMFRPPMGHRLLSGKPGFPPFNQLNWLLQGLENSQADWKFISTGTPFNPGFRAAIELALLLQNDPRYNPIITPEGPVTMREVAAEFSDKWAGFPETIFLLLSHIIKHNIENVIFISGDTHTAGIDDGANSIIPELMAGGLDRTNGRIVAMLEQFGIYIYNKGGHTSDQSDFGNAYGRITVFGADSVLLEAVSENGNVLGHHVVKSGFIPSSVGATVVPLALDFDRVPVGETAQQAIIITNTSIDPVFVERITSSDPVHFQVFPRRTMIMPGKVKHFAVFYTPTVEGEKNSAELTVYTNDPDGPAVVSVSGKGLAGDNKGKDNNIAPREIVLKQNYPNPFNPTTTIEFSIPKAQSVSLKVYNLLGQQVATLAEGEMEAGLHRVTWNASGMASGLYYYRLRVGSVIKTRKLFVMK